MTIFFKKLIYRIVGSVIVVLTFSQHGLAKEPTILHISITDEFAVTSESNKFTELLYADAFPDRKFIEVVVAVPRLLRFPEAWYRQQALKQMKQKISDNQEITHLIISTHGATETLDGKSITSLDIIGEFGEAELDSKALEFFSPLTGRMAENAHVFFNSCNTFCGIKDEVGKRAQKFLQALNVPNGSVYGAEIAIASLVPPGQFSTTASTFYFKNKKLAYVTASLVAFQIFVVSELLGGVAGREIISHALTKTGAIGALLLTATPIAKIFAYVFHATRILNFKSTGKLVTLENGKVAKITDLHQVREADKAYGVVGQNQCVYLLMKLANL